MKKLLMTGAAIMALSTAASASTFSLIGGTAGSIPGGAVNDVLTNVFGQPTAAGAFGAQVSLDSAATVTVDFLGFEAGWANKFCFNGCNPGFDTESYPTNSAYAANVATPLASYQVNAAAGVLSFSFTRAYNTTNAATVTNGANPANVGSTPNFFVSYGVRDPHTIYLWLDDGGAGNDDNHDDLVVRLTTSSNPPGPTPVPLPAAGLMLMGALGGLGLMKRRK